MSRVTRRKHVLKEMMEDDFDPPQENQQIVRILSSRGNNLHEVEPSDDTGNFLVSMPTKFRKNVWVKRGDFVLVEPIEEGDKVKAEICKVLTPEHVKEYTKLGIWPKNFTKKREYHADGSDDDDFVRNTNRPPVEDEEDTTETESEDDD